MMNENFLTLAQKKDLQKALKNNQYPEVRERILIFLLRNEGRTQAEIAEFLGCSRRTVAYWCIHGDPSNIASLQDRKHQGNNRKVTDEYRHKLLETAQKNPWELGLDFEKWTADKLANYMFAILEIRLSSSQVRRILRRESQN